MIFQIINIIQRNSLGASGLNVPKLVESEYVEEKNIVTVNFATYRKFHATISIVMVRMFL